MSHAEARLSADFESFGEPIVKENFHLRSEHYQVLFWKPFAMFLTRAASAIFDMLPHRYLRETVTNEHLISLAKCMNAYHAVVGKASRAEKREYLNIYPKLCQLQLPFHSPTKHASGFILFTDLLQLSVLPRSEGVFHGGKLHCQRQNSQAFIVQFDQAHLQFYYRNAQPSAPMA